MGSLFANIRVATGGFAVPAALANQYIRSAPFKKQPALDLLNSLKPLMQWQSTLAYLKDPHSVQPNYRYPPTDLIGGIDALVQAVNRNGFSTEVDFQQALSDLMVSAHDYHNNFHPQFAGIFSYSRPVSLVSMSPDGLSLPKIYSLDNLAAQTNSSPSYITSINGLDPAEFVLADSVYGTNQDVDANYEQEFFGWTTGRFKGSAFQANPGLPFFTLDEATTYTYSNGSQVSIPNVATVGPDLSNITDGESFYQKFGTPKNWISALFNPGDSVSGAENAISLTDLFPTPVAMDPAGAITAHLVNDTGLKDVCILSVNTFDPQGSPTGQFDFQQTVEDALAIFEASGRSKLIVDVSSNGGSVIALGNDLFTQLFPDVTQYQSSNTRAHQAINQIGEYAAGTLAGLSPADQAQLNKDQSDARSSFTIF